MGIEEQTRHDYDWFHTQNVREIGCVYPLRWQAVASPGNVLWRLSRVKSAKFRQTLPPFSRRKQPLWQRAVALWLLEAAESCRKVARRLIEAGDR
jgi:hypothetical protein